MTDLAAATKEDYSDLPLPAMEARNNARLGALADQGVGINDLGMLYMNALLPHIEELLGDQLTVAREEYQRMLGAKLDAVEAQVLRMRLGIS